VTEARSLFGPVARALRLSGLCLAVGGVLSACTKDDATDFCKNHYRFHEEHKDTAAALHIKLISQGSLSSELTLPLAILDSSPDDPANISSTEALLEARLGEASRVYTVQSEHECTAIGTRIERTEHAVIAHYESECGTGNKIGQIDVTLFDHVPELEEVVVNIATPATAKRFAISRQCSSAIFRLDGNQGH